MPSRHEIHRHPNHPHEIHHPSRRRASRPSPDPSVRPSPMTRTHLGNNHKPDSRTDRHNMENSKVDNNSNSPPPQSSGQSR